MVAHRYIIDCIASFAVYMYGYILGALVIRWMVLTGTSRYLAEPCIWIGAQEGTLQYNIPPT